MRIKNSSERRIGMNIGDGRQLWLEQGVNEVSDADWKSGKADVSNYIEAGELAEVVAKAPAAAPVEVQKKDDAKK